MKWYLKKEAARKHTWIKGSGLIILWENTSDTGAETQMAKTFELISLLTIYSHLPGPQEKSKHVNRQNWLKNLNLVSKLKGRITSQGPFIGQKPFWESKNAVKCKSHIIFITFIYNAQSKQ